MVTGHKDKKGDFHPHTKSSGGVSENDMKISVKGSNDVIGVHVEPAKKLQMPASLRGFEFGHKGMSSSFQKVPFSEFDEKGYLLKPLMEEKFYGKDLHFVELLDPKQIEEHGGYRFIVTNRAHAHTGFHTKEGLEKWLDKTGLKLEGDSNYYTESGHVTKGKPWKLVGNYKIIWMAGNAERLNEFAKKENLRPVEVMNNARNTRGYVRETKDGNIIYALNTNYGPEELPYDWSWNKN